MTRLLCVLALAWTPVGGHAAAQPAHAALIEALRPALPYPDADEAGMQPVTGGDAHRWFVIWPRSDEEPRVIVRANPLHPDTQKAVSAAEAIIQRAIAAAERKAQAAYDRALEQLRQTGKGSSIDGITLDDEGIAGQRIDADLELVIARVPLQPFVVAASREPVVAAASNGASWIVRAAASEYLDGEGDARRPVFHPAEAHLLFGQIPRPDTARVDGQPRYRVSWHGQASGFAIVLRGNEALLQQVLDTADWSRLSQP
jgi:hypothetical protein